MTIEKIGDIRDGCLSIIMFGYRDHQPSMKPRCYNIRACAFQLNRLSYTHCRYSNTFKNGSTVYLKDSVDPSDVKWQIVMNYNGVLK